jgi:hypothetical protein
MSFQQKALQTVQSTELLLTRLNFYKELNFSLELSVEMSDTKYMIKFRIILIR